MAIAFLYAGQGSQHTGMGKDLYERYPEFRTAFESGNLDFDLKQVCFENPDDILKQTEYTQPAMVAFACGMTALLKKSGITPDFAAGLSLGEYSALHAAGVLDAGTAIRLVAFRGKAMAEASEGIETGMQAVIGLDAESLNGCVEEARAYGVVSISNYNCPGQLVIGGEKKAVEICAKLAKEKGARRCIPLNVSGPFHTSLMQPAGEALRRYFQDVAFAEPEFPVLFNVLGRENTEQIPLGELLVRQVQESVRMEAIIGRMLELGVTDFIEIGPGAALSGFVKKTAKAQGNQAVCCYAAETADDLEMLRSQFGG